jgi:hypothetical protein
LFDDGYRSCGLEGIRYVVVVVVVVVVVGLSSTTA